MTVSGLCSTDRRDAVAGALGRWLSVEALRVRA